MDWNEIRTIIDEALEKHDRSVTIFISGVGTTVKVCPWPDYEDLYEMYKEGKITFNDFRAKAGLSMMKSATGTIFVNIYPLSEEEEE